MTVDEPQGQRVTQHCGERDFRSAFLEGITMRSAAFRRRDRYGSTPHVGSERPDTKCQERNGDRDIQEAQAAENGSSACKLAVRVGAKETNLRDKQHDKRLRADRGELDRQ